MCYKNTWVIRKRAEQKYFSMTDGASLQHLLRAFEKVQWNILKIYHFNKIFFDFIEKKTFLKLLLRFSQNMVSDQKKLELLPHCSSYTQDFFFVLNVSVRVNFCPDGFFIVGSSAEKSGICCRQITVFSAFLRHVY